MWFLHTFLPVGLLAQSVCMQSWRIRLWQSVVVPWFLHWNLLDHVGSWKKYKKLHSTCHQWCKALKTHQLMKDIHIYPLYIISIRLLNWQFPKIIKNQRPPNGSRSFYVAIWDKSFRRTSREIMSENQLSPGSKLLQEVLILWAMEMSAG